MIAELNGVTKSFDGGGEPVRVLEGLDFSLDSGAAVSVVGASGCGKSTFLNVLGTLDRADGGSVRLLDEEVGARDADALADLRARHLGFIFQMHHLLPQCSVLENVLVPTLALHSGGAGGEDRARKLLDRVGLGHRIGHRPAQLSGGERQRVAVVRALINKPKLLLADEPTGALDRTSADGLAELLLELNREEGVALVVVTHDRSLADRMSTVYTLVGGKLESA